MSTSTAELTLILKARNLADAEFTKIKSTLSSVAVTAGVVANDMATAFRGVGQRIARQMGNLATDILAGGDIVRSLLAVGATMAGAAVEGVTAHLLPGLLARLGATTLFAPLAAAMTAGGGGVGAALAAAIGIGMAALPVILLAAAGTALVYLATNPEARQKAHDVAVMILGRIGDGLAGLGGLLLRIFGEAFQAVLRVVTGIMSRIVGAIGGAIQAVADLLTAINKVPNIPGASQYGKGDPTKHGQAGGWVGLRGPELVMTGENGPEFIRRAGTGSGGEGGGVTIQGISQREIIDMVERGLYFRLRPASPSGAV